MGLEGVGALSGSRSGELNHDGLIKPKVAGLVDC